MDKKSKISIWEYFQSERYHQMTEESLVLEQRLLQYAEEYKKNHTILGQSPKMREEIVMWKYAVGGDVFPRGPLCPGHMGSLLCGNVKRGRLVKRSKKPSFTYGYDENGELCSCINPHLDGREHEEHIVRKGNLEVGVKPKNWEDIVDEKFEIVEVVHDEIGRVKTYLYGCVNMMYGKWKADQYYWESYQYNNDNTVNVENWYVLCENMFTVSPDIRCDHVVLYLDADRKVEKYSVCEDISREEIEFYEPLYEWVIPK